MKNIFHARERVAADDAKLKRTSIRFAGLISVILASGGILALFFAPDRAKDAWLIIGPILSPVLVSMVPAVWSSGSREKRPPT